MSKYYNKNQHLFTASLRDGTTAVFAGKSWTYVSPSLEGSEDLIRAVNKGVLVRRADPIPVAAPVTVKRETDKKAAKKKVSRGRRKTVPSKVGVE